MERLPGPLYAIYQVHQLLTILLFESFSLSFFLCMYIYTHTVIFLKLQPLHLFTPRHFSVHIF